MNSETVDLIATDPPFNKGKDFHATPDSLAKGASFQDRWSWEDDIHETWTDQIEDDWPNVWEVINSSKESWGDDMGAYLCFMGVRLIAMRRLLKPTGSIYLHCDPTASHYLKMLMDAIFGRKNFINEIVWLYKTGGMSKRWFGRKHDIILFYSKQSDYVFNPLKEKSYLSHKYGFSNVEILEDEQGVYTMAGMRDYWDIPALRGNQPETYGFPTQKPLALYERMIEASSNGGDMVLDPFAGCATTLVACERLKEKRQWVGIDIWDKAQDAVVDRLETEGLYDPKYKRKTKKLRQKSLFVEDMHFTSRLPVRTDNEEVAVTSLPTLKRALLAKWQRLSNSEIREELEDAQLDDDGEWIICAGCGRELEGEFMELDHITPRSGRGANDISNRILLCSHCNRKKSNMLTLAGLRKEIRKSGWMVDEDAAKAAERRAHNRYVEVSTRDT